MDKIREEGTFSDIQEVGIMRFRMVCIASVVVAFLASGCTANDEMAPAPTPSMSTTPSVVAYDKVVRELTNELLAQGWPVLGHVRYADNSSSGFDAILQFKDCDQVEVTVDSSEPGVVLHDGTVSTKPPTTPFAYAEFCPDKVYNDGIGDKQAAFEQGVVKQLKTQGFNVRDDGLLWSEGGSLVAFIRFAGCDIDTTMVVVEDEQLRLFAATDSSDIGDMVRPPADPKKLKALCAAG